MTGRKNWDEIEKRLEDVRRLLRERHARFEPDAHFADRIVARLTQDAVWSFDWAARRILPVSLALALALTVAVLATGGFKAGTSESSAASVSASTSASATSQKPSDPLEWLLENRQEIR
jgi:hypothetical protein